MTYKIKAPHAGYERKLTGVRFTKGEGVTDDAWAASWFSGRDGFTVEVMEPPKEAKDDKKPKPPKGAKENAEDGQGEAN